MKNSKKNKDLLWALNETNLIDGLNDKPVIPQRVKPKKKTFEGEPSCIDLELVRKTFKNYGHNNNFTKFLFTLYEAEIVIKVIEKYLIGTSTNWSGSTIFWLINRWGDVRSGKIIQFDRLTGKRNKANKPQVRWAHELRNYPDFNFVPCFFGGHLLYDFCKPVAIVDSEETACIASIYVPKYIWLASGGLTQLTAEKCKALESRKVVLYPSLGGYERWKKIATRENYEISDYLERIATEEERNRKLDIADYFLKSNLLEFKQATDNQINPNTLSIKTKEVFQPIDFINEESNKRWWEIPDEDDIRVYHQPTAPPPPKQRGHSQEFLLKHCDIAVPNKTVRDVSTWDLRVLKLEQYISITRFPTGLIQLNPWTTIDDIEGYIADEMTLVKTCNKNPVYLPYLERLESLVNIFKNRDLELVSNILDIDASNLNLNGSNQN